MNNNTSIPSFSPEIMALIKLGELALSSEKKHANDILSAHNNLDWDKLYNLARFHQIRPLLLRGVSNASDIMIPDTVFKKLKSDCQHIAFHGLSQTQELLRLLNIYKKHNILAIPYKGAWLSNTYYGDFGMREFSDIDLFVYEKDIFEIKKIMLQEGYVPCMLLSKEQEKVMMRILCEYNFDLFNKENKRLYHIEPHYKSNGISDGVAYLSLFDFEHRLYESTFANTTIRGFSVEDNILLTCIHHGMKEGWTLLKYLFDVYAILKKEQKTIDWGYILEKAEQLKITKSVIIGLSLIQNLFQIEYPDILKKHIQDPEIKALTENRYQNLGRPIDKNNSLDLFFFNLKCINSWSDRLKIIAYRLFYPHIKDIQFVSLPNRFFFIYFFIRPIRGVIKFFSPNANV